MAQDKPTNEEIAGVLDHIADLLEAQDANRFRIGSYRDAAKTVRNTDESVAKIDREEGQEALEDMEGIGESIAGIIDEYVTRGRSRLLQRLQGEVSPQDLFKQIPGVGDTLAGRIAEDLDVNTLEELEQAAHDSHLSEVSGLSENKVEDIKTILAGMLSGAAQSRRQRGGEEREAEPPPVSMLLDVDREYRQKAEEGKLKKIAPKRFNPENEAWLPILHAERDDWDFTVLYSNTKRAHELEKTHDWVVIYYKKPGQEEHQNTVVTSTGGDLKGKRVVRGREQECKEYYKEQGELS